MTRELSQAHARIRELVNGLRKHMHTEECFLYAARTASDGGNVFCIANCTDSRRKLLKEERTDD